MLGGTGCSWRKGTHYSPEDDPRPEPKLKRSPYTVNGKRYRPMDIATALQYSETGEASVYNDGGSIGAMGERLPKGGKYAAHRTLPLPSVVRVTSLKTGKSCDVRVCDRGPFHRRRIIDISPAVARAIGFHQWGVHQVEIETVSVGDGPNQRIRPQD
jgi:rare lipoprotein A